MNEAVEQRKKRFAEEISEKTEVEVGPEHIKLEEGRAVLSDEGAEYIARERGESSKLPEFVEEKLDMEETTFRAMAGYIFAVVLGGYAVYELAGGRYQAAVGPAGIALLGLSLGRYYQTALRV